MNIAKQLPHNPISNFGEMSNFTNATSYNAPNSLKWSDCSFDAPYNATSSTAINQQQTNLFDNTLRKDLFDTLQNDYKSLPVVMQTDLNMNDTSADGNSAAAAMKWNQNSMFDFVKQDQAVNCNNENDSPIFSSSGTASETTNITLANHSKNSGFIEVSPSSASTGVSSYGNAYRDDIAGGGLAITTTANDTCAKQQKFPRCMQTPAAAAAAQEEENLLTSERTHFCPIKQTYTDGYSFEIPSHLDEINYTRSASGSLYLDSAKYMEYNPMCNDPDDDDDSSDTSSDDGLVLKFCVKQIEKCCQTDSNSIDQHYLANRYSLSTNAQQRRRTTSNCTTTGILSPDIEMDYEIRASFDTTNNYAAATAASGEKDLTMCNNLDMENWTMGDGQQKCLNNNNNSHALWEHCTACECDIVSMPANRLLKDELCADGDEIMFHLKYMQDLYIESGWENDESVEDDHDHHNDDNDDDVVDDVSQPPLQPPELNCNDNTEPDAFFYNFSKLLSDFLKPETAKSLANAFVHSHGANNTVIEEIVMNDATKVTVPTIDSHISSIWSGKIVNDGHQPVEIFTKLTHDNQRINVTLSNDNNNNNNDDDVCNNNNNNFSDKYYVGGLWGCDNDNGIWQGQRNNNNSNHQTIQQQENTIQANNNNTNIWSTNCFTNTTKSVAATTTSINVAATVAATTTNTLSHIGNAVDIVKNNALSSSFDNNNKQNWEHSYLEEIWKTDTDAVAPIMPTKILMMNDNNNAKCVDISRSGGGGNSGGTITDNNEEDKSTDNGAITLFTTTATGYEHSYDLSNVTLEKLKASIQSANENYVEHHNQQSKLNRYDRKRRHSASQNITNLLDPLAAFLECDSSSVGRKISTLYDGGITGGGVGGGGAAPSLNVTTTIITCNYWATDDDDATAAAAAAAYFDNYNNKGMNRITTSTGTTLVNPSLILKNIPMVSRPLTR